jgi:Mrp family chromosome partitioning ATPase
MLGIVLNRAGSQQESYYYYYYHREDGQRRRSSRWNPFELFARSKKSAAPVKPVSPETAAQSATED